MSNEPIVLGAIECPICMDIIELNNNCVMTKCGHTFHCSCLMQNAAHNGFMCPYCRAKMAEEPKEYEYEDEENDEENEENALTSFRMFYQRINGEEVEEEPENWWSIVVPIDIQEDNTVAMPDAAYTTQKLIERGITMEDLVKHILFQEYDVFNNSYSNSYSNYSRLSFKIYEEFEVIINQYTPPLVEVPSITPPTIAESKTTIKHNQEIMFHI